MIHSFKARTFFVTFSVFLICQSALAGRFVSVEAVRPLVNTTALTVNAAVDSYRKDPSLKGGRNYLLTADIPKDLILDLSVGSTLIVQLPTVRDRNVRAQVTSVSTSQIKLLLKNQIQLLEGQNLKVTLPVKPTNLYQIPFQAIYSPRGITTEVFVIDKESRVQLVPVLPIRMLTNGDIIVSSSELKDATLVVQGIDNLVPSDKVQIVKNLEVNQ